MNLTEILDVRPFSKTEEDIVIEIFDNPVVKNYLKTLAKNDLLELATLSITERDNSEVAKKHALIQGRLSTIVTLLSISTQPVTSKQPNKE